MGKGKHRLPTKVKELRGTLRPSRLIPNEMAMVLVQGVPEPPENLPDRAKQEYYIITQALHDIGLLAGVDITALLIYCNEVATYCAEDEEVGRTIEHIEITKDGIEVEKELTISNAGIYFVKDRDGNRVPRKHPAIDVRNNALKNLISIGSMFGVTPAARTKISMPAKEKDDLID